MGKIAIKDVGTGWALNLGSQALAKVDLPPELAFVAHIGLNLVISKQNNIKRVDHLAKEMGLEADQVKDLMKYTGKNLDAFEKAVKNGGLDELLGLSGMNMSYLIKQTGKNTDEINEILRNKKIDLKDITSSNIDGIIKKTSGDESGINLAYFLSGMNAEDAKKYLEWNDLVIRGFTAEERYNLSEFGSIKTQLDYTRSTGLKSQGTPGKTTTILGTYNSDTGAIIDELGNIKSTNLGPRNGGFNLLNIPDEEYSRLGPDGFWEQYNKPWLDKAINRKDIIKISTEPSYNNLTRINNITGKVELSGFGKEYKYLKDNGYIYDSITKSMIKK